MFNFIRNLFPKAFVAIDINFDVIKIHYLVHIEGKVFKQDSRKFTKIKGKIPEQFFTFISPIVLRYSNCYIVLFFNKQVQNTIVGNTMNLSSKKMEYIKNVNMNDKYLIYCNKFDIKEAVDEFKGIKIDLLISPFVVLNSKYYSQETEKQQFVILAKKNLISMSIFDDGVAVLSSNVAVTLENSEEDSENPTSDMNDDNLDDVFDDEDMKDFDSSYDDIDDSFDDIDNEMDIDLDDLDDDEEAATQGNQQEIRTSDLDDLNLNLNTVIKHNIEDFMQTYYSGERYEFLSNIRIYNDDLIDSSCIKYLQDELMMDIDLIHIDIPETLLKMAKSGI